MSAKLQSNFVPVIVPLGDRALLVRFGRSLSDAANQAAIGFARLLQERAPRGIEEIVQSLVSVQVSYDPNTVTLNQLAGELALLLSLPVAPPHVSGRIRTIDVSFGGGDGPDLGAVAQSLGLSEASFIDRHNREVLRVLATGFAPGFVYCGFHPGDLIVPRRTSVRDSVPAGSILFAAGQTAMAATSVPTGWHLIGRTAFRNFDPQRQPPTQLMAGEHVQFGVAR